jgi:hypothetical protein
MVDNTARMGTIRNTKILVEKPEHKRNLGVGENKRLKYDTARMFTGFTIPCGGLL